MIKEIKSRFGPRDEGRENQDGENGPPFQNFPHPNEALRGRGSNVGHLLRF